VVAAVAGTRVKAKTVGWEGRFLKRRQALRRQRVVRRDGSEGYHYFVAVPVDVARLWERRGVREVEVLVDPERPYVVVVRAVLPGAVGEGGD
jgi:hypothetical protein